MYKLHQAFLDNMGFYATCAVLGAVLVVILVISGNDLEYVIYGLMACTNAICLVIVAILFGYGLAEYPRSLWQVRSQYLQIYLVNHQYRIFFLIRIVEQPQNCRGSKVL